jgi:hypothetical protein
MPAHSLGLLLDDIYRPVDVEAVQKAFGEHASAALDHLYRHKHGGTS